MRQGRSLQEFVQGDLHFFLSGGAEHPLGPEDSLKSIDFTGTGEGGWTPWLRLFVQWDPETMDIRRRLLNWSYDYK